jgi:hypothetical protein
MMKIVHLFTIFIKLYYVPEIMKIYRNGTHLNLQVLQSEGLVSSAFLRGVGIDCKELV